MLVFAEINISYFILAIVLFTGNIIAFRNINIIILDDVIALTKINT